MSDRNASASDTLQDQPEVISLEDGTENVVQDALKHAEGWIRYAALDRYADVRHVLATYRGLFPQHRRALDEAADTFESLFTKALSDHQQSVREDVRTDALAKMRLVIGGAMTELDFDMHAKLLTERSLEEGGAISHDMKIARMHRSVSVFIAKANAAKRLGSECQRKLEEAVENKWISKDMAKRKHEFIFGREHVWSVKHAYITSQFSAEYRTWRELAKELERAKAKAKQMKLERVLPETKALFGTDMSTKSIEAKRSLIDFAYAAMAAHETNRRTLYRVALSELQSAVSRGSLASNKVGTWMRRIFESGTDMENIKSFLSGKGKNPLSKLIESWDTANRKYENIERKRRRGYAAAGFHFVTKQTFLNWHYAARLAYIEEAEKRLENDKFEGNEILWDIRRELDMKDWDHARWLMDKAQRMNLNPSDRSELRSMQRYLTTQRAEEPQADESESNEHESPGATLCEALHELEEVSPVVRKLYEKASRRGFKAVSGLNALMYNRCWIKQNYTDKFERERSKLREEAKESTKKELVEGDDGGHKMSFVPTGGKQTIRDYKGEWTSQVLFANGDGNRQDEILSKCETSNNAFRYWTSLYVDGVDYEQQTHIVSIGRKVKGALRGGAISNAVEAKAESENETKNAA